MAHRRPPVAFVVDSRTIGGAEVYVALLLRRLPGDLGRILAARQPVPAPLTDRATAAGVPVVAWTPTPAGLLRLYRALRSASIVHLNLTWPGANGQAAVVAWLARRPVVATLHLFIPPRSRWRRSVLRLVFRRFARVIAVSGEIARVTTEELGVPAARVRLVRNGVEVDAAPSPAAPPGRLRVGSLGRLTGQKGYDVLIAAVALIADRHPGLEVRIAGDGPDREALVTQAQEAKVPVELVGRVDDPRAFLRSLDVFCLPSRREGLPFAVLEAMAAGLPCLTTAVGELPVCLGEAGVTVAPDDAAALAAALDRLLASPDLRARLGAAARDRVAAQYSVDAFVEATVAVYGEVRPAWVERPILPRASD